jgi:ligand-binding sensor domain-containing protein/signal transduction histidine kinase
MWSWIIAGWLLCASALNASATTSTVLNGARYAVDTWENDDGIPQNSVITMVQTRDGYLWLGTLNGLVRFDGMRFVVFDENNTPEFKSSRIIRLLEDRSGRLWIGTENAGVLVIGDDGITPLPIGPSGSSQRLAGAVEDPAGRVWLYTANGELWRHHNGRLSSSLVEAGRPSFHRSILVESSGKVLAGTDWSIVAINPEAEPGSIDPAVVQRMPVGRLDFMVASQQGGFWRLADGRIQKWTTNGMTRDLGSYPWGTARVSAACEDRQGNLIVGTLGSGVYWFGATNVSCLSTTNGLSHNFILSLLMDREGSLWVGTDGGGLNRVKHQVFDMLEQSRGIVVQSVCEDARDGLWLGCNVIGSSANGVGLWKDGSMQWFGPAQGLMNASVRTVFAGRDQVWVGNVEGLFSLQNGRFRQSQGEVFNREIMALHQDREGRLWVGMQDGLARRDTNGWIVFRSRDGLTADAVRAIADDREGNLWIGTVGGGLNCLRDGRFTAMRQQEDGLPSDEVSSLLADRDGVLWVGTFGNGLARLEKGRWTRYSTRDGLIGNSIGYMIEDDLGFLWIGSRSGLMRISKQALNDFAAGKIRTVACRAYGKPDGLPSRECVLGFQPGAGRTRDGRIWFPTIKGLASVNPAQILLNTTPPPVVIESVLLDDRPLAFNTLGEKRPGSITIPANGERIEIHYTCLNLGAPERARFKYFMENHETGWIEADNVRVVRYSKLPPGDYRFHVTACNEDGVWNATGSSLAFVVEPPFWRQWWFITLVSSVLLGLIVAVVHYISTQRLQRQLEHLRQHEALEKDRARIARDIHDQLGASLTQVSLLGEMAEADKNSPEDVEAHARQICQTARDTTRSLDEIVWTVNPANDTLDGLITYICKHAQEYLEVAGLRYRLEVPAELPAAAVSPEVRHNVFLAAKEAVTNVVRHAQASSVRLRLELVPGRFTLEIQDDGRGPAGMEGRTTRNGLKNMRKRMEDVGGTFSIAPAPERGTLVRMTAPLSKS